MLDKIYGTPGEDAVTFINRFTVHGSAEAFERSFADSCAFMAEQDGYLGNTLFGHAEDTHAYINIALWGDAERFRRAVSQPSFGRHREALRVLAASEPGLYRPRWTFEPGAAGTDRSGR